MNIVFLNTKGGVGKTTLNFHIPTKLAQDGAKVCVVDLDDQANASQLFGCPISGENAHPYSAFDLVDVERDVPASTVVPFKSKFGVDVIPAHPKLPSVDQHDFSFIFTTKARLLTLGQDYDYLFIDTPGAYGNRSAAAMAASHRLFIPLPLEELAVEALSRTIDAVKKVRLGPKEDLRVDGFIPSMVRGVRDGLPARQAERLFYEDLKQQTNVLILPFFIEREMYRKCHRLKTTIWDTDHEDAKKELSALIDAILAVGD